MPLTVSDAQILPYKRPVAVREITAVDLFGSIYKQSQLLVFCPNQRDPFFFFLSLTVELMTVEVLSTRIALATAIMSTDKLLVCVDLA